jgi:hypothetical protein
MYSFAKFRADHIFLQNRDRKNIKKFAHQRFFSLFFWVGEWVGGVPLDVVPAATTAFIDVF